MKILILLAVGFLAVSAFSSSDDKFIKKYAMMKIYESCFGQEVIREIREEMKYAVAKCAAKELEAVALQEAHLETTTTTTTTTQKPQYIPEVFPPRPPNFPNAIPIAVQPLEGDKAILAEISIKENTFRPNFDPEKLQQAILSYRPGPFKANFPGYPTSYYPSYAPNPYATPIHGFYPGVQAQFAAPSYPMYPPFSPQYFPGQRMSRDFDINSHVDSLKARLNGKVKNVTCVMQELGYLNENLEPTYEKIIAKIQSLQIQDELKHDIIEGVDFCKQFAQCIPESKNEQSPFSNALMKPMFFFKCYKHKKLEACIMKDVRDRIQGVEHDNFDGIQHDSDYFRKSKSMRSSNAHSEEEKTDDITTAVFDILFGNSSNDLEDLY